MAKTLFFDEAGNTGDHLSNADQPAFVLASHQIEEARCRALLAEHFPRNQAAELKHVNVRKHRQSQKGMAALASTIRDEALPIAVYPMHKRFALFQRLFDYLVEPVIAEAGGDAFEDGFNIEATNVAYVALSSLLGEAFMTRLLSLFETAARDGSRAHLAEMWRHLERARARRPGRHRVLIDILLISKNANYRHLDSLPDQPLNLAIGSLVALMAHWRSKSPGPFEVIHDQSKDLARNRAVWDWLSSPEQQEAALGFGDFRDVLLPLNVERTELARSHDHAGLQLADLLAGANLEICRFLLGDKRNDTYARELIDSGLDVVVNNIWPDIGWSMPAMQGRSDALDPNLFLLQAPFPDRRPRDMY